MSISVALWGRSGETRSGKCKGEGQVGKCDLVRLYIFRYTNGRPDLFFREALDRSVTLPDRSMTRSPVGSIRTIESEGSTHSGSGSASTVFVPPLELIPDLSELQSISGSSSRSLSRRPLSSAHHTRATDDAGVSNQAYLYPGDPRVIAPSRSSSLRRTSSLTDLDEEFASATGRSRTSRSSLGVGVLAASPKTSSSGSNLDRDIWRTPPLSTGRGIGSEKSATESERTFFSGSSGRTSSSFPRRSEPSSLLGDSRGSFTPTSLSQTVTTPLSRAREVRRRTPRSSSRTYSSISDESSDKENSGRSYTPTRSSSGSYTPLGSASGSYSPRSGSASYTPTPSSGRSDIEVCTSSLSDLTPGTWTTSSSGTPGPPLSAISYESLPSIPSESDYETPDEGSSHYVTASICSTTEPERAPEEGSTRYVTASICSTTEPELIPEEGSSRYITASICSTTDREPTPAGGSTQYVTASICSSTELEQIPSEIGSARDESEVSERAVIKTPTIVSSISTDHRDPVGIPLPPSTVISSSAIPSPPSSSFPSSTPLVSRSLDVPSSPITERLPTTSTPSTVSSIRYSEPTLPASSPPLTVYSESSYDSTILQASSPSVISAPLYQGPDTSFNTSFLRPSSALSSLEQLPTIPETPTMPSSTLPSSVSRTLSSPSSLSFSTTMGDLSRTTSIVSSLRSSIFDSRSLVDFEEPSTVPSLLSAPRSPQVTICSFIFVRLLMCMM
jgi:hypothetical protein